MVKQRLRRCGILLQEEDQDAVRTLDDDNFIDDTGVDPADRYGSDNEPRSTGDAPQIRIYTPKRVFQELEVAKEEYIRATFGVRKDQKILLPKSVESFKDSGLCPAGLLEMIQQCVLESVRKSIKKCLAGKSRKSIEWIPYNFAF